MGESCVRPGGVRKKKKGEKSHKTLTNRTRVGAPMLNRPPNLLSRFVVLHDVITHAKFGLDRFTGFRATGCQSFLICICKPYGPYYSALHYRAALWFTLQNKTKKLTFDDFLKLWMDVKLVLGGKLFHAERIICVRKVDLTLLWHNGNAIL